MPREGPIINVHVENNDPENNDPEIPKAILVTEGEPEWIPMRPRFLTGKMTFIGIALSFIAAVCGHYHIVIPNDEIMRALHLISDNWDFIAVLCGLAVTLYGRLRLNWTKK